MGNRRMKKLYLNIEYDDEAWENLIKHSNEVTHEYKIGKLSDGLTTFDVLFKDSLWKNSVPYPKNPHPLSFETIERKTLHETCDLKVIRFGKEEDKE